jgi:hypothetical protein
MSSVTTTFHQRVCARTLEADYSPIKSSPKRSRDAVLCLSGHEQEEVSMKCASTHVCCFGNCGAALDVPLSARKRT